MFVGRSGGRGVRLVDSSHDAYRSARPTQHLRARRGGRREEHGIMRQRRRWWEGGWKEEGVDTGGRAADMRWCRRASDAECFRCFACSSANGTRNAQPSFLPPLPGRRRQRASEGARVRQPEGCSIKWVFIEDLNFIQDPFY